MIRIVTDSDSNLPSDICDDLGIIMVPILIIFGEETYREYVDITIDESYDRMRSGVLPTTSQPSVGDFSEVYDRILRDDPAATILSIHVSGPMSGTCESARLAAKMLPDADIRIFDTRLASLGEGMMAREAAIMARQGADIDSILARLAVMRDNAGAFFFVKTLDYLVRGGRIGRASGLVGSMLGIKPVLTVTEGVVAPHSKFRTWRRALVGMEELVEEGVRQGPKGKVHLAVMHCQNENDADFIADRLRKSLDPDVFLVNAIGPGLGAHLGEGTLGVCWTVIPD